MGILTSERDNPINQPEFEAAEGSFFCGKPMDLPAVYWQGHHGQAVYLHPECAGRFGSNLTVDARVAGAQPTWTNTGTPYMQPAPRLTQ